MPSTLNGMCSFPQGVTVYAEKKMKRKKLRMGKLRCTQHMWICVYLVVAICVSGVLCVSLSALVRCVVVCVCVGACVIVWVCVGVCVCVCVCVCACVCVCVCV